MARKQVHSLDCEKTFGFGPEENQIPKGKEFKGYYLGSKKVKSEYGEQLVHIFKTAKGNVGLWGSANLNSNLAQIEPGCMTFVTYNEKIKLAGGKSMKKFSVEFDDEDKIDNAPKAPKSAAVDEEDEDEVDEQEERDSEDDEDDSYTDSDDEEEEQEEEEDDEPKAKSKGASAKDLLSKRRSA